MFYYSKNKVTVSSLHFINFQGQNLQETAMSLCQVWGSIYIIIIILGVFFRTFIEDAPVVVHAGLLHHGAYIGVRQPHTHLVHGGLQLVSVDVTVVVLKGNAKVGFKEGWIQYFGIYFCMFTYNSTVIQ